MKETTDVEVVRDFLSAYPNGKYALPARLKLKELENKAKLAMALQPQAAPKKQLPRKPVVPDDEFRKGWFQVL